MPLSSKYVLVSMVTVKVDTSPVSSSVHVKAYTLVPIDSAVVKEIEVSVLVKLGAIPEEMTREMVDLIKKKM